MEVIGQYQLTDVLGGGGMATVYRGVHVSGIGMVAAIKKLHPHLALDAQLRARLKVEAQALVRLDHPNIVRILDYVDANDHCALVTELVEGDTLRTKIHNDGKKPMVPYAAVGLMKQILAGVGYAHSQKCLHRDIKPGNIMVTPDGVVKVLDFGIASLLDTERMTRTGVSIGTPVYMAPEQIDGMDGLDAAADIYSLGVTFWEMLAGPNARPIGQKGWRIGQPEFERLFELGIPQPLIDVVEAMTREDRSLRIATCSEALKAIEWAQEDSAADVSAPVADDDRTVPMNRADVMQIAALTRLPRESTGHNRPRDPSASSSSSISRRSTPAAAPPEPPDARAPEPVAVFEPDGEGGPIEDAATALWSGPQGSENPELKAALERTARPSEGTRKRKRRQAPEATLKKGSRRKAPKRRSRAPWLAVGVAGLLAVVGFAALRGPSVGGAAGGDALLAALRAQPATVVFERGPFYYGPEDRKVVLSAFALDEREVSLGEWRACSAAGWCPDVTPRYANSGGIDAASSDEPMQYVTWSEAVSYCAWRGKGRELPPTYASRLPTDAEWERAARGSSRPGRRFPHGAALDRSVPTVSATRLPPAGSTAADRTPDGVRDLTGSVAEWVYDTAAEGTEPRSRAYPAAGKLDPVAPGAGPGLRAVRGGSGEGGGVDERNYESQGRHWVLSGQATSGRGFRCAVGPTVADSP